MSLDPRDERGCRCGHKLAFCHRIAAATWCGSSSLSDYSDDELRRELETRAAFHALMKTEAK